MTPQQIRETRIALGLTQEQLADLIGVRKQAVLFAETGRTKKGSVHSMMVLIAHYGQGAVDVLKTG